MRPISACLLLLGLPLSAWAQSSDATTLIDQARAELHDLDSLIDDADVRSVQRELHNKADHIEELLRQLDTISRTQGANMGMQIGAPGGSMDVTMGPMGMQVRVSGTDPVPPPPPAPEAASPCPPDRFQSILASVQGESFSDGKLQVLRSASMDTAFSAAQAATLMGGLDFGRDQVEAGVILFPHVIDPQNWYRVYEVFDFDSDKDKLRQRVGR